MMKKMVLVLAILGFVVGAAFAGGDQNCNQHRGDIGQGAVEQHQIRVNQ